MEKPRTVNRYIKLFREENGFAPDVEYAGRGRWFINANYNKAYTVDQIKEFADWFAKKLREKK